MDERSTTASAPRFEGRHISSLGDTMSFPSIRVPAPSERGAQYFTDDFGGALLSVQIIYEGKSYLFGTAFMVMPGLAITAAHVFEDFEDVLSSGAQIVLLGWKSADLRPWSVTKVHYAQDVALMEIEPRFELDQAFDGATFELTARLPPRGEMVLALGLISEKSSYDMDSGEMLVVSPVAASGPVIDWQEKAGHGRGVQIICDFFGPRGMSGGPIFDKDGRVFGILSSAIGEEVGEEWTCYVAAPWPAFMQNIQPQWPPGLYSESSLWPGHVADAWHLGIGEADAQGNMQVVYIRE